MAQPCPVAADASHVVRLDIANHSIAGFVRADVAEVVVEAPPGYRVIDTAGLPFGSHTGGGSVFIPSGPADWPSRDAYFRFERHEESADASAPVAGWAVTVLALALVARRRR